MSEKAEVHFKDGLVMFPPHTLELMLRREREKEREECAKIVYGYCESDNAAQRIVDAIRARNV